MLELGEDLHDRIEIRTVGRQEKPVRACGADGWAGRLAFVTAGIIEHDDIARLEGADKELFDIGAEALAVNRSVKDAGRLDPVHPQGAARKVSVRQRPRGDLAIRRRPRAPQPRSGAMLVLTQVSSRKTRRRGSTPSCRACQRFR